MSAITPESFIKLVRFDVTKEHQVTFSDGVSQVDFFINTLQGELLNASSYQRKDNKVRFPAGIDSIEQYNYMVVQNLPYNYKYFFYYITDMQYINDEMTEVTIKLDVFQTYQFDFNYGSSYVEREHVNDDTVGKHTVPEGLETGEFIINDVDYYSLRPFIYMVQCKKDMDGSVFLSTNINGVRYAGCFYACGNYDNVADLITYYTNDPDSHDLTPEDIVNIYLIPIRFTPIDYDPNNDPTTGEGFTLRIPNYSVPRLYNFSISKRNSIDGYVPKNNKLLTKEFNYLVVSNLSGATEDLAYEEFKTSSCNFSLIGMACINGSGYLIPQDYGSILGEGGATGLFEPYYNYAIPTPKFPIIDSNYDYFRTWVVNNSFNIVTGAIESGIESLAGAGQIGVGTYSGDMESVSSGIGRTASIFGYALNLEKEIRMKKRIPPVTISHANSGTVLTGMQRLGYIFNQMCVKREYAKIIDNFFSHFGYKVMETKIPNITGRQNWNYVKTIEAVVDSNVVPEKYLNEYKGMLNSGITFWHDYANFLDYTKTNNIV